MIISYSKQFIFMHSRKTAGSTVTSALNRHLGNDDIQLGAWPDTIEAGGKYNMLANRIAKKGGLSVVWPSIKWSMKRGRPAWEPHAVNKAMRLHYFEKGLFGGTHSSASDVRAFDPEFWNTAFKFCFVRNPWNHAVSDYHWRKYVSGAKSVDFKEYLRRLQDFDRPDPERIRPPIATNWSIYTIGDEIAVDYVARYEDLSDELHYIGQRIGAKVPIGGINSKGNVRDKSAAIRDFYDEEAVEIVRKVYLKEVDAFDYKPFV